jgi:hypothetical protein
VTEGKANNLKGYVDNSKGYSDNLKGYDTMRSTESTHNIESIITQMREILNE